MSQITLTEDNGSVRTFSENIPQPEPMVEPAPEVSAEPVPEESVADAPAS